MKPRTVYEKAVQDFTETAQQLARLDQHFRQASFAEFKMLIAPCVGKMVMATVLGLSAL